MNEATAPARGHRKERIGTVTSAAMQKTVIVRVESRERHPLYGKEMRTYSKFYAHDEAQTAKKGDRVRIVETRPMSRLKRWRVIEVLGRPAAADSEVPS